MIYKLLHTLLARFISLFVFWIPEVVERKKFELKNKEAPSDEVPLLFAGEIIL